MVKKASFFCSLYLDSKELFDTEKLDEIFKTKRKKSIKPPGLFSYRVTKYNPEFRVDDKYLNEDWTSISDVGKVFSGQVLTMQKYEETEHNYINFVKNILQICGVGELKIVQLEKHNSHLKWKDQQWINRQQISLFMKDCLREKCWAKLEADEIFIHFGYDYYMYIGTCLSKQVLQEIGCRFNLFIEKYKSPYCN